ncbi:MAG: thiamine-phosphate kinase [Endomicrobiales bacterium]|nr:thiamine-phosphate kinase [Endomicrobiales bacterium]
MKISSLGEFRLIEEIKKKLSSFNPNFANVVIASGDDAFAGFLPKGKILVATTDALVQGVHFRLSWMSPQTLGKKAVAVNVSDLAAMGGAKPLFCLVTMGLPKNTTVSFVKQLYSGLNSEAKKYGAVIVGGDTVRSNGGIFLSLTLLGSIKKAQIIKRSGAKVGDVVCSTGTFGDAAAGLKILESAKIKLTRSEKYLVNKQLLPQVSLENANLLSKFSYATSMLDSSDGLAISINLIAQESSVGISVALQAVPVSNEFNKWASEFSENEKYEKVINGGEEYCLVFTTNPKNLKKIQRLIPSVKAFGIVTSTKGVNYTLNGKKFALRAKGFSHFG